MKLNKSRIFRERDLCKEIYESKSFEINFRNLLYLGKYLRFEFGYKQAKTKTELLNRCLSINPDFNINSNSGLIDDVVRSVFLYIRPPENVERVEITNKDLEKIRTVKNFKYQIMLLSMLIWARAFSHSKELYVSSEDISQIKEMAKIYLPNEEYRTSFRGIIKSYGLSGYKKYKDTNGRISLLFDVEYDKSDVCLVFSRFENIRKQYIEFLGGEIFYCSKCQKEEIKRSNRHKLCAECRVERERETDRERKRKERQNKDVRV